MKFDWGPHHAELVLFLEQHAETSADLSRAAWFQPVLCGWGAEDTQKDSAECTQRLLEVLQLQTFDMRWERRFETSEGIQTVDASSVFTPVKLFFPSHLLQKSECPLHSLITAWSQEHSMSAALMTAPPCLCLHLDRYYHDDTGALCTITSAVCIDTEVNMPIFTSANLRVALTGYIPVAGIAHKGLDRAGHYQTALKIQPTVVSEHQPAAWLITEDGMAPKPVWHLPSWFGQGLTVIWLVRTDCLQTLQYRHRPDLSVMEADVPAVDEPPNSTALLLHLLQAQHGACGD